MGALTLPEELKPAMAATISLSDEAFQELLNLLQSAPMSFSDDELTENLKTATTKIPPDTVRSVIEMLVSLQWVRSSAEVPLSEFLTDVVAAIEETELKNSIDIRADEIQSRLSSFLNTRAIAFAASARQLRRNYERTFCNADLLTDIRPMFGSGDDATPLAAVLVHTLKISYHQRTLLKDFFLALTSDDLDSLEELIDKAREQSDQLNSLLDTANLAHPKLLSE